VKLLSWRLTTINQSLTHDVNKYWYKTAKASDKQMLATWGNW